MSANKWHTPVSMTMPGLALVLASAVALSACDRNKGESAFPVPKVPPPPVEQSDKGATYPGAGSDAPRADAQGNGANITGKDPDLGVTPKASEPNTDAATPRTGTGAADVGANGSRAAGNITTPGTTEPAPLPSPAAGGSPSGAPATGGTPSGSAEPEGSTRSALQGGSN